MAALAREAIKKQTCSDQEVTSLFLIKCLAWLLQDINPIDCCYHSQFFSELGGMVEYDGEEADDILLAHPVRFWNHLHNVIQCCLMPFWLKHQSERDVIL